MRLPRDINGTTLVKGLKVYGYNVTRQAGSHIRLTTHQKGEHHITIPNHTPIKIGTLSAILQDIALHFGIEKDEVINKIFG